MKINIKLKNPKYCNDCPLSWGEEALDGNERFLGRVCRLGYWTEQLNNNTCESYIKGLWQYRDFKGKYVGMCQGPYNNTVTWIKRPEKCIKENGY